MERFGNVVNIIVSTHSRLKAAGTSLFTRSLRKHVSTHSRLKAAGLLVISIAQMVNRFNTQPPEGGWDKVGGA